LFTRFVTKLREVASLATMPDQMKTFVLPWLFNLIGEGTERNPAILSDEYLVKARKILLAGGTCGVSAGRVLE